MSTLDRDLSEAVAKAMRPRPKDKDCYRNAFRAFVPAKEVLGVMPWYVEGFAGVPHAWLETDDGRVIDVTPLYLDPDHQREYEPRFRHTLREVLDHVNQRGATLPVHTDRELYGLPPITEDERDRFAALKARAAELRGAGE